MSRQVEATGQGKIPPSPRKVAASRFMDHERRQYLKPCARGLHRFKKNERGRFVPERVDKAHTFRFELVFAERLYEIRHPVGGKTMT